MFFTPTIIMALFNWRSNTEDKTRKLILKVTTGVQFSFDDKMWQQVDGVAIGSLLGPVLANIFVGFYEQRL